MCIKSLTVEWKMWNGIGKVQFSSDQDNNGRSAAKNEKFSCGNKGPIQFTLVLVEAPSTSAITVPLHSNYSTVSRQLGK